MNIQKEIQMCDVSTQTNKPQETQPEICGCKGDLVVVVVVDERLAIS